MRHSVLFATAFATLISTQTFAADLPGKGITVNPVQSTITEETFQTLLVSRALEKLGYTVNKPSEVDYNVGYTSLASGDATFTAVNWTPLHDNMYEAAGGDKKFYREGVFVNGAAQGYLIDKKTADQYKITNIAQLKDPKIAKLFDTNGDGKADLTGCNPGWGCEGAINHQLAAYELTHTVTHNQGNYAAMMADTISRYKEGKPVFYYTWTPYWVSNELKPGAARFVQQFGNQLAKLEPIVSVLQSDPEQFEQLKEDYAYSQQMQRSLSSQSFPLFMSNKCNN